MNIRAVLYNGYQGFQGMHLGTCELVCPDAWPIVRIEAAALNPKDLLVAKGKFRMLSGRRFPMMTGLDFAGSVERAGHGFSVGERVFGMVDQWRQQRGTLAEYVSPNAEEMAHIPSGVASSDAASVALVGLTALQALRDIARLQPGGSVLINGASGGLGTIAIQIARLLGAEVTTISSGATVDLCTELGASRTLTYEALPHMLASGSFDALFDVFGNLHFNRARGALRPVGVYVGTVPSARLLLRDVLSRWSAKQERMVVVKSRRRDLEQLGAWLASGALRAVIARRFPLERHRDAFAQLASKHTHGKIVIDVGQR